MPRHSNALSRTAGSASPVFYDDAREKVRSPTTSDPRDETHLDEWWKVDLENFLGEGRLRGHGEALGQELLGALSNDGCLVSQYNYRYFSELFERSLKAAVMINKGSRHSSARIRRASPSILSR